MAQCDLDTCTTRCKNQNELIEHILEEHVLRGSGKDERHTPVTREALEKVQRAYGNGRHGITCMMIQDALLDNLR